MAKRKPKAKAYIDGSNVFYSQRKLGWTVDWAKAKKMLGKEWDILEIKYYTGIKPEDEKMKKYLRYLDKVGLVPVTKPLKTIKISDAHPMYKLHNYEHIYKSNFDVEMTVDMLLDKGGAEELILFSGDSDFQYLVKKLKDLGRKVTVFSSRKTLSWELKLESSKYIYLEDIKGKISKETK